ncbi:hypothetical protein EYF80_022159 [Liparis tanakae]|uniref:Uncharacterized protein n=1 Tax=Liparis tanakae TaxID=230148 RepID=A0A4Z2HPR6_9TELE|nr:hypothetical protein EYF80_022159 [Liparis tanakae]
MEGIIWNRGRPGNDGGTAKHKTEHAVDTKPRICHVYYTELEGESPHQPVTSMTTMKARNDFVTLHLPLPRCPCVITTRHVSSVLALSALPKPQRYAWTTVLAIEGVALVLSPDLSSFIIHSSLTLQSCFFKYLLQSPLLLATTPVLHLKAPNASAPPYYRGNIEWSPCDLHMSPIYQGECVIQAIAMAQMLNSETCRVIDLPSCTAWKGLFPSTNSTEMVIFSVSKISLFKLRSATARRKTSSSFRADSSKMAPIRKGKKQKGKEEYITQYFQDFWN